MENNTLWMVRAGRNAAYADDFVEQKFVGIGFAEAAEISTPIDEELLEQRIAAANPIGQEAEIVEASQPTRVAGQLDQSADDIESRAHELIDDQIAVLDGKQLQELVAEILKAMGFRAETSERGRIERLSEDLTTKFGRGFLIRHLRSMRIESGVFGKRYLPNLPRVCFRLRGRII